MNTQHTPGPWTVTKESVWTQGVNHSWRINGSSGAVESALIPGGSKLATVYDSDANARLIAAAPELLVALKPFADLLALSGVKPNDPDGDTFMTRTDPLGISTIPILTVAHLRAAAAAIAKATATNA